MECCPFITVRAIIMKVFVVLDTLCKLSFGYVLCITSDSHGDYCIGYKHFFYLDSSFCMHWILVFFSDGQKHNCATNTHLPN